MASASITLTGAELGGLLASLGERARLIDFTRPLKSVALYLASEAQKCFAESRAPDGVPWKPLKNPSMRRGGSTAKPLRDTDLLMGSVYGRVASSGSIISEAGVIQGASADYAGFQHYGTRTIPARPFLGVTSQMKARIREILFDWAERV